MEVIRKPIAIGDHVLGPGEVVGIVDDMGPLRMFVWIKTPEGGTQGFVANNLKVISERDYWVEVARRAFS